MMAPDPARLAVALVVGGLLGAAYFGGLYLTTRRLPRSSSPHLLMLGSFVLRLAVVLGVFYLLTPWGATAMLLALGGFLLARLLWVRATGGRGR